MAINITNNKPIDLNCVTTDKVNKPFDPISMLKEIAVTPLHTPLIPNHAVKITSNGHTVTDDDIVDIILKCCDTNIDPQAEDIAKELYSQALVSFPKNSTLAMKSLFAIQSGSKANLPEPSPTVVYTPAQDIIPISRKFLAGTCDYDTMFASFAFYANPNTLGFYFANEQAFEDFKTYMSQGVAMLQASLSTSVSQMCGDFQTLTLKGLTESIILRNDDTEGNDPFSFARIIINRLMTYTTVVSSGEFGVMPFDISELIRPKSIVFVNLEQHSRASSRKVAEEWKTIASSLQTKVPMVSINKLTHLTAMQRNLKKIQAQAATALSNQGAPTGRNANVAFRKTAPNSIDLSKIIKKIMNKMANVNKSMNSYKCVKSSFARANRRDPDDFNKPGKIVSTQYKPDIHLYVDTSGSISEENYQDAVKACIYMAKKMNVNMYFNSFSHVLSQAAKLNTRDKSVKAIYKEFQKIPKVTGGTDFKLVWDYINRSKTRQREISILMTDFEWHAPNEHIDHPKNLYYIPCSKMDWDYICRAADSFVRSAEPNVPGIRKHVLF